MSGIIGSPFPKFPKPDMGGFFEKLAKIGKYIWAVIRGKDEIQDEISNKKGLNPEKSEANEFAELNKLLNDYKQNILSMCDELERKMIVECSMQLQEVMGVFEEYNKTLKITRSESIKRKFRRIEKEIRGTFSDYIHKKISLDDPECVKTLKLPAGELKNQRLQEMKEKVILEAENEVVRKIRDSVDEFSETVEDAFQEHLDRTEQRIIDKSNAFEELSKVANGDMQSAEKTLVHTSYILSVCSYADALM